MIEEKYKKLKNQAIRKALYLSGSSLVLIGLACVFIFAVKIIPLVIVIAIVAFINWAFASHYFHQTFMRQQQDIIEQAFKENMAGFHMEIGGIPKQDILKKVNIEYAPTTAVPSFVISGEMNGVRVTSYSISYKVGIEKDYTYARVYSFSFKKKPYALNLKEFDSPIVVCSDFTETKYTEKEIFLHFACLSKEQKNIYSLFLNKYNGIEEYISRIKKELDFIREVIEVAKND